MADDITEVTAKKVILKNTSGEYLIPYTDPIPVATTSTDGLMSSTDKAKLDDLVLNTSSLVTINTAQSISAEKTFTVPPVMKANYSVDDSIEVFDPALTNRINFVDENNVNIGYVGTSLEVGPANYIELGIDTEAAKPKIMLSTDIGGNDIGTLYLSADRSMVMGSVACLSGDIASTDEVDFRNKRSQQTLYQGTVTPSNWLGKVELNISDNKTMYILSTDMTRSGTITFNTTGITAPVEFLDSNRYGFMRCLTFEVYRPAANATDNVTWPSNVTWLNGSVTPLEANYAGLYAFRSFNGGATWIGNLQATWQESSSILRVRFLLDSSISNYKDWYFVSNPDSSTSGSFIVDGTDYYSWLTANDVRFSGFEKCFLFTSGASVKWQANAHVKSKINGEIKTLSLTPTAGTVQVTGSETLLEITGSFLA